MKVATQFSLGEEGILCAQLISDHSILSVLRTNDIKSALLILFGVALPPTTVWELR